MNGISGFHAMYLTFYETDKMFFKVVPVYTPTSIAGFQLFYILINILSSHGRKGELLSLQPLKGH